MLQKIAGGVHCLIADRDQMGEADRPLLGHPVKLEQHRPTLANHPDSARHQRRRQQQAVRRTGLSVIDETEAVWAL